MAGNLVKSVMLKITASDGDTEAKLDRITAKADELGEKHPDIKVKIDSAAASAKLAVLRAELRDTARDEKKASDASMSFSERLRALGGSAGAVTALDSGLKGAAESGSKFGMVMAGLNIVTGLGEPLMAGLLVTTGALSAGLVSASAGLGVFGLAAKSVWSSVSKNVTAAAAAQEKIAAGATGKNLIADNKALAASLKGLNAGQQSLVLGASNAELSWHKFTLGAAAGVSSVLVPALGLVPKVLSLMSGFLPPVESALRGIVSDVSHGLGSAGFTSFVSMLQKSAGPMITDLAKAIGNVVVGIGGILKAFMPVTHQVFGGLDSLTKKFATWGTTLTSHSGFKDLMGMFKSETPLAVSALKSLIGIVRQVVSSMTGLDTFSNSRMLLQLANPILKFVNALVKAHPEIVWLVLYLKLAADGGKKLKTAFQGVSAGLGLLKAGKSAFSDLKAGMNDSEAAAAEGATMWTALGSNISGAVTAVKGWTIWSKIGAAATRVWTGVQAAFDAVMDANPVALVVIAVAALVAAIVILTVKFKFMRDFWKDSWKDITAVTRTAFRFLEDAVKLWARQWTAGFGLVRDVVRDVFSFIAGFIRTEVSVVRTVLGWFGRLGGLFRGWWDDAVNAVESVAGRMLAFVRSIPGKILSALASLPGQLFSFGARIISMLASGIMSAIGSVAHAMTSIGSEILDHIPHSPAKKGPLSGAGSPDVAGRRISQMLGQGIILGLPSVTSAAHRMAGAVSGAVMTGGAMRTAGGGGTPIVIEMSIPHGAAAMLPAEFWTEFKNGIRVRGGDPRIVTAKVKFA